MIGLLGKDPEMVEGEGLLESECPLATQDEIVNKGNKQKAILVAMYGPADDTENCGNCEYGNKLENCGLKKGEVFCEKFEFKCSDKNVCDAWDPREEK
jgi:hypothetical protein